MYHAGLATHYVESAHLLRLDTELLCLPSAECTREGVNKLLKRFQPESIASFSLDPHLDLIDECFGGDSVEECMQRLEKKAVADGNEFAREQLDTIKKMVTKFNLMKYLIFFPTRNISYFIYRVPPR